jgi:hypothetical protein
MSHCRPDECRIPIGVFYRRRCAHLTDGVGLRQPGWARRGAARHLGDMAGLG